MQLQQTTLVRGPTYANAVINKSRISTINCVVNNIEQIHVKIL